MTLYINACPREESRTERLARAYLAHISDVTELNVYDQPLVPLDRKRLAHRESLIAGGKWHDPMFDYAHQFADADDIIIAAPYWDLAFPAALKVYLEWSSMLGITFHYTLEGKQEGLCKAGNLVYITTSGGEIGEKNYGYDYLKGLSQMFGISRTHCLTAEGLDVWENDPQAILNRAKKQAEKLAASL